MSMSIAKPTKGHHEILVKLEQPWRLSFQTCLNIMYVGTDRALHRAR